MSLQNISFKNRIFDEIEIDFFTHLSYDILANYWGVNSDTIRGGKKNVMMIMDMELMWQGS